MMDRRSIRRLAIRIDPPENIQILERIKPKRVGYVIALSWVTRIAIFEQLQESENWGLRKFDIRL
jgi:hypothetical protein